MASQKPMNLLQFQNQFSTEEACQAHLFNMKWPNGFHCERCQHDQFFQTTTRKLTLYECKKCRYQATVTVGTIFERTRTDLRKWFWAIYFIAHDKRGVSATLLVEELSVTYKTAWLMLHKIRSAMGERDSQYTLAGIVELDDAFFGAPTEGGKRGRGTLQTKVLVGLSLNNQGHPQYLKMKVIPDVKGKTLVEFANQSIVAGAKINSDAYRSYNALADEGFDHTGELFNLKDNPDHLKWLHTVISNAKAFIGGTFHGLHEKHMQAYLNEYCYRFNRRKFKGEGFNRLLSCCASTRTITYSELAA